MWAIAISIPLGYVEFGDPLDVALLAVRNQVRMHDADGSVVVVGIDNVSADRLGGFPWSRVHDAEFIDRAFKLGARRIFFDKAFADAGDPRGNAALAKSLDGAPGRVFFGVGLSRNRATGNEEIVRPIPIFRGRVGEVSLNMETGFGGHGTRVAGSFVRNGIRYQSMAAQIAGMQDREGRLFRPDYAIRAASFPMHSYADVVDGRVASGTLRGKDVVVGAVSSSMHDDHWIPGQGTRSGVYSQAIAGETLKHSRPTDAGWIPGIIIAAATAFLNMFGRSRRAQSAALVSGLLLLVFLPLVADMFSVRLDNAAGIILVTIAGIRWTMFSRAHRNAASDLPNLAAFKLDQLPAMQSIIVLRIHNFAEIAASFDAEMERSLVQQVVHRVRVTDRSLELYQGDEGLFLFTSSHLMSDDLADHLQGLHKILAQPVAIGTRTVDMLFGFGIDDSFNTNRSITTRVNSAMVAAVETASTGLKWQHYEVERFVGAAWKLSLLGDLDQAVREGTLNTVFQPKFDLKTRSVVGFEALARWNHPTQGMISPDIFIRAAEDSNRIAALTGYILNQALEGAAALRLMGLVHAVAVNLSSNLLLDDELYPMIDEALSAHDFPAEMLTLELTESGRAIRGEECLATLSRLRTLGIKLSIDDFGTGNATMDYVQSIPSHELKIDKKFIAPLNESDEAKSLVQGMITMAHSLNRIVVAEGVEHPDIEKALVAMGCDVAQGYGLARPMQFSDLATLLGKPAGRRATL